MDKFGVILIAAAAGLLCATTTLRPKTAEVVEGQNVFLTCSNNEYGSSTSYSRWTSSFTQFQGVIGLVNDTCTAVGFLAINNLFSWYCNDSNSFSLLLRNVNRSRHGERWSCIPVANVLMDSKNKIISTAENTTVQLSCTTSVARPAPNITWYVTGEHSQRDLFRHNPNLTVTAIEELFSSTSKLVVHVNRFLESHYLYCSATNYPEIAVESEKVLFDVKYPPLGPPEVQGLANGSTDTIVENQQDTLICTVRGGNPLASVTWDCFDGISKTKTDVRNVTTEVTWIALRDWKTTTCTFKSEHVLAGKEYVSVNVEILYMAKVNAFYVKGHEGQSIVTVTENDTVQFICLFDRMASNAKLMFRWTTVLLEDGDTINLTNIIIHISCEDIGYYTCVGRNTYNFGQPSIEQLTLLVMCPPHRSLNVPFQENYLVNLGDSVTFSISIRAYPEPDPSEFSWMKLETVNWILLNNTSLTKMSTQGLQTNLTILRIV